MKPPSKLYRYRSLGADVFNRELDALEKSYLYAPPFSAMNDPMEAFYETGGQGDTFINLFFNEADRHLKKLYEQLDEMIGRFALVSFSSSFDDLPLWAYYGGNFGGICLEFETERLPVGDFQNEQLRRVTYAQTPLPAISMAEFALDRMESSILSRVTRKRIEWAHEKEWRYVTGQVGPKHYLDDALTRVFLGPRLPGDQAEKICNLMARRPVEILQGRITGFNLTFETVQLPCPLAECDRVGAGKFVPSDDLWAEKDLRDFLDVPFETLLEECRRTAQHPNMDSFSDIDIGGKTKKAIYFWTVYKLRSGREIYNKRYFDRKFQPTKNPSA